MNKIIGYKRKERNFWPYVILAFVVLFILSIAFMRTATVEEGESTPTSTTLGTSTTTLAPISTTSTTQLPQKKEKTSSAIEVEQITLTSGLNAQKAPVDDLAEVSKDATGVLYCYIKINCPVVPQAIRHVWVDPQGKVAADVKLFISNQPAYTWSYISLYDKEPGKWEVQVVTPENVILARRHIIVYNSP